jgi:hypothetical protein
VRRGKRVEREDVVLGNVEERGDLRVLAFELIDGVAQSAARFFERAGGEQRADERAERVVVVLVDVAAQVAQEVDGAALPGRPDLGEGRREARVRVGEGELNADQAPEEGAPERLGLGLADIEADDLAPAGLGDGVRDDDALANDPAAPAGKRSGRSSTSRTPFSSATSADPKA